MANALRIRIEPIISQAVAQEQQGFLQGRSLVKSVVDVDAQMRIAAMEGPPPAAIFYDFTAASPSVSHKFLVRTLEAAGMPRSVLRVVECLYWGHGCRLAVAGRHHSGFGIKAGIRQGCPLVPLVFAVAVDPLLRKLARAEQDGIVRAYAHDIAQVVYGCKEHPAAGAHRIPRVWQVLRHLAQHDEGRRGPAGRQSRRRYCRMDTW